MRPACPTSLPRMNVRGSGEQGGNTVVAGGAVERGELRGSEQTMRPLLNAGLSQIDFINPAMPVYECGMMQERQRLHHVGVLLMHMFQSNNADRASTAAGLPVATANLN